MLNIYTFIFLHIHTYTHVRTFEKNFLKKFTLEGNLFSPLKNIYHILWTIDLGRLGELSFVWFRDSVHSQTIMFLCDMHSLGVHIGGVASKGYRITSLSTFFRDWLSSLFGLELIRWLGLLTRETQRFHHLHLFFQMGYVDQTRVFVLAKQTFYPVNSKTGILPPSK